MVPSEEFAALHLRFAARASELERIELSDALARWTPARRQGGPAWAAISLVSDPAALARAYRAGSFATTEPRFGCFWYESREEGRVVRLHFANREGPGVLGADRLPTRRDELAAALGDARAALPGAEHLRCGSWLYHLARYRALFPPSLLATATPADTRRHLNSLSLWGQFLRGDGQLFVTPFVQAVERAAGPEHLVAAFPLTRLDMRGSLDRVLRWLESGSDS